MTGGYSMEYKKRHAASWILLRPAVKLLLKLKFNYSSPLYAPDGPYLVLCNHVTDWDPLLLGVSFKKQMYFVSSEHVLRKGFASKLINFFQPPIARQKGGSAVSTVKSVIRTLKDGHNVCIFPEGNRTWDGRTRDFPAATGKLAKSSGCSLVTFRITGGYFASPRWAGKATRRGRTFGELVNVYTPEQLKTMSAEEVNRHIAEDIYEDAYARQREVQIPFKGRRLAESLETLLFICPKCGELHSLKSSGSRFGCTKCGANVEYTPTGFFEGGSFPYDNVCDWSEWQIGQLRRICQEAGDDVIFEDEDIPLSRVITAKGAEFLGRGRLALYKDRLELPGSIVIPAEKVTGMSMLGSSVLFLGTADGESYELRPDTVRCMSKYLTACTELGYQVGVGV